MRRVGVALAGIITALAANPAAGAQTTGTLGGYSGSAAAAGLHLYYNPQNVLPIPPLVEVGAPDTLATIASGPATYGRASVADPGDLLANPDALFALFSSSYPAGTIPPYPYRIASSSSTGAADADSEPAPGFSARTHADDRGSSAVATMPLADAPAVASVGSLKSISTTTVLNDTVKLHARSEVNNFSFLGLFTFQSLVTDLTATSVGGAKPVLQGTTTITGATFMGAPAAVDDSGLRQGGNDLGATLAGAGIKISVASPVQEVGQTAGQLTADGLRIDIDVSRDTQPQLHALLDAAPSFGTIVPGAPSPDDIIFLLKAHHVSAIEIGRGSIVLAARSVRSSVLPETADLGGPIPDLSASGLDLGTGDTATLSPVRSPANIIGTLAPVTGAVNVAAIPAGFGVGGLLLLALLLVPFAGYLLARRVDGLLAADGASCPWEEP